MTTSQCSRSQPISAMKLRALLGVSFWRSTAVFTASPNPDPSQWTAQIGVDKRIRGARVRAGAMWLGPSRTAFATLGVGTYELSDGGGIEYGVAVPLTAPDGLASGVVHQISVRFGAQADLEEP